MRVALKDLELDHETVFNAYDVWKHEVISQPSGALAANLKPHECQVYILSAR